MASGLISILLACFAVLFLLALFMAGIDFYFDMPGVIDFSSAFTMNIIFTFSSGLIMFLSFLLVISKETLVMKVFRDLNEGFLLGLLMSFVLMYFTKHYLLTKYAVVLNYAYLVVFLETASLMIVPYLFNHLLGKFAKAFAH